MWHPLLSFQSSPQALRKPGTPCGARWGEGEGLAPVAAGPSGELSPPCAASGAGAVAGQRPGSHTHGWLPGRSGPRPGVLGLAEPGLAWPQSGMLEPCEVGWREGHVRPQHQPGPEQQSRRVEGLAGSLGAFEAALELFVVKQVLRTTFSSCLCQREQRAGNQQGRCWWRGGGEREGESLWSPGVERVAQAAGEEGQRSAAECNGGAFLSWAGPGTNGVLAFPAVG